MRKHTNEHVSRIIALTDTKNKDSLVGSLIRNNNISDGQLIEVLIPPIFIIDDKIQVQPSTLRPNGVIRIGQ